MASFFPSSLRTVTKALGKTRLFITESKEFKWSEKEKLGENAVATSPLVKSEAKSPESSTLQAWFADDSAACGNFNLLETDGKSYASWDAFGYCQKLSLHFGGMGTQNPVEISDSETSISVKQIYQLLADYIKTESLQMN